MINTNIQPKEATMIDMLPAGIYVGKVVGAEVKAIANPNGSFERLEVNVDVAEGAHKDHFEKQFQAQSNGMFPAKWKGVVRYNIPQEGSQFEQGQRKALEHLAWCLEDSNPNYKWDGDETKLKGLAIGLNVRERDWVMERNEEMLSGTTTEVGRVESVKKVRAGEVRPMRKKELKAEDKEKLENYQKSIDRAMIEDESDDDCPF